MRERDEYFSRRGYYLQGLSFDHNYAQGLVLQQIYGVGIGSTLFKKKDSEFDVTSDLHYERQHFNATANVSALNLHLVGSDTDRGIHARSGASSSLTKKFWRTSPGTTRAPSLRPAPARYGCRSTRSSLFLYRRSITS